MRDIIQRHAFVISGLILVAAVFTVYLPTLRHDFADWDDRKLIAAVWKPSWDRAASVVRDFDLSYSKEVYYAPLPMLSLMLDQAIVDSSAGPRPWIAKFTNTAVHAANTVLVFLLLHFIGLSRRIALAGALLFALHPLQVGTVAWVTERKNVLVTLFYLAALLSFLRYLQTRTAGYLAAVVVLFLLGLLSKPIMVTLPVALVSLALIAPDERAERRATVPIVAVIGGLFALSSAWGIFVLSTERTFDWILPPLQYRPLLAAGAIWFYVSKFVVPLGLVPLYPRWDVVEHVWTFGLLFAALGVVILGVLVLRRRIDRWILWGGFFFLLNLAPVSGLVPFGYMSHSFVADHLVYLPLVGLVVMVGRAIDLAMESGTRDARGGIIFIVVLYAWVGVLGLLTIRQTAVWENPLTIWRATLTVNEGSFAAHNNYGLALMRSGQLRESVPHFERAAELAPRLSTPRVNLGEVYLLMGDLGRSEQFLRKAREINPRTPRPIVLIGQILVQRGKIDDAAEFLEDATKAAPRSAEVRNELGSVYLRLGRMEDASNAFEKAIELNPFFAKARLNLAKLQLSRGKPAEAAATVREALKMSGHPEAYHVMGVALAQIGKLRDALRHFLTAFEMQPEMAGLRSNIANAFIDVGDRAAAREFCRQCAASGLPCSTETLKRLQAEPKRDGSPGP